MRSTFSVSTWTWTLAGCLAFFLGCSQGEGDRCEVDSDCNAGLTCDDKETHNGVCGRRGSGAGGSTGQGTTGADASTDTSQGTSTDASTADASVAPSGEEPDGSVAGPDALAD